MTKSRLLNAVVAAMCCLSLLSEHRTTAVAYDKTVNVQSIPTVVGPSQIIEKTRKKVHKKKKNKKQQVKIQKPKKKKIKKKLERLYSGKYFKIRGVIRYNNFKFSWYSQKRLPGGGLKIPGRHVDKEGFVCDKDNNIVLASSELPRYKKVLTPFGKYGKIYDSGCAKGTLDVYTN